MDPELEKELLTAARRKGLGLSGLVRMALIEWLEQENRKSERG